MNDLMESFRKDIQTVSDIADLPVELVEASNEEDLTVSKKDLKKLKTALSNIGDKVGGHAQTMAYGMSDIMGALMMGKNKNAQMVLKLMMSQLAGLQLEGERYDEESDELQEDDAQARREVIKDFDTLMNKVSDITDKEMGMDSKLKDKLYASSALKSQIEKAYKAFKKKDYDKAWEHAHKAKNEMYIRGWDKHDLKKDMMGTSAVYQLLDGISFGLGMFESVISEGKRYDEDGDELQEDKKKDDSFQKVMDGLYDAEESLDSFIKMVDGETQKRAKKAKDLMGKAYMALGVKQTWVDIAESMGLDEASMKDIIAKGDRDSEKRVREIISTMRKDNKSDKEILAYLKPMFPEKRAKEMLKEASELSSKEMYDKLMGHFKRNKPGRHSGHAGEYFKALKKVKIDNLSDREEKMIKELWSMYGSKLECSMEESKIELEKGRHEYPYKGKHWPVAINADIDARGGMKGKGTSVTLFLKDKDGKKIAKGFQGPATIKSVSDFIKKWASKGMMPNDEAEGFNESLQEASKVGDKTAIQAGDRLRGELDGETVRMQIRSTNYPKSELEIVDLKSNKVIGHLPKGKPALFGNTTTSKAGNGFRRIKDVVFEAKESDDIKAGKLASEVLVHINKMKFNRDQGNEKKAEDHKAQAHKTIEKIQKMKTDMIAPNFGVYKKDKNANLPLQKKSVVDMLMRKLGESRDSYGLDALNEKLNSQNGNKFLNEK